MRPDATPWPNDPNRGRTWGQASWLDYRDRQHVPQRPPAASGNRGDDDDKPSGARLGWLLLFVLLAVVCYNLAPIVENIHYAWQRGRLRAESEEATARLDELARRNVADTSLTFPLVVQRVRPCVVQIDTLQERMQAAAPGDPATPGPRRLRTAGQGAGLIADASGYILTNYHVIRDATLVRVRLSDGRRFDQAEVVGVDPQTDLAVLKIEASGLLPAAWGDSDRLQTGEWVLAVGNPFGLDRSVTAGIVSAKHRRNVVQSREMTYEDFLQTDAAVNPGNSGGPLVNMYGEVVGIATAIVGESFQGVGFAIPSDIARDVYERLKSSGKVVRGWLGVVLENVTPETAQRLKIPAEGIRVSRVLEGAPAHAAGVQLDDVIIAWNGEKLSDYMELSLRISRAAVNSQAKLTIRRGGEEKTLTVTVGQRDAKL
jgi:serine protease Do